MGGRNIEADDNGMKQDDRTGEKMLHVSKKKQSYSRYQQEIIGTIQVSVSGLYCQHLVSSSQRPGT